jgi:hypothetical protein
MEYPAAVNISSLVGLLTLFRKLSLRLQFDPLSEAGKPNVPVSRSGTPYSTMGPD